MKPICSCYTLVKAAICLLINLSGELLCHIGVCVCVLYLVQTMFPKHIWVER